MRNNGERDFMKLTEKRSKLVVTIGPSTDNYEVLKTLILAGATCIRANFSHGSYEEQKKKFDLGKQLSKDLHVPISLMLDTKGPEIRIGKMKNGIQEIQPNSEITILTDSESFANLEGEPNKLSVSYDMSQDVKVGDTVLFDDGKLTSKVIDVKPGIVVVKTVNGHNLKTNKRINLPGVDFTLPFLSEKDVRDVLFGIENEINYVAASFVNSAENVHSLRKLLNDNGGSHIQIISKIESRLGIDNIDEIIEASDGIMVARGDLGLEIDYYDVPYYEKMLIRKCREAGKPVIVATQMLDSMENNPHPTRAEVTDVYYATELGADSTMLSGESATGKYPLLAVETMATINKRAEKEFYDEYYYNIQLEEVRRNSDPNSKRAKIAYKVANWTRLGEYKFAVVLSRTGQLLKEVAKFRPNTTIVGVVNDSKLLGEFGVISSVWMSLDSLELFEKIRLDKHEAVKALLPYGLEKGDKFLVVQNDLVYEFSYE